MSAAAAAAPVVVAEEEAAAARRKAITLTAARMYPPFQTELASAIEAIRSGGGQLRLVGILGTGKDDAKTYAEVRPVPVVSRSVAALIGSPSPPSRFLPANTRQPHRTTRPPPLPNG